MHLFKRYRDPVILLYNVLAFGMVVLMIGNSERIERMLLISADDGSVAIVTAGLGIVLNLANAYLNWRDRNRGMHQDAMRRNRITGE